MPYISNKNGRRDELDPIVCAIGRLDILGDSITSKKKIKEVVQMMVDVNVKVDGDLNYILYAVCKRYVKPSYNNYKKYLTKLTYQNYNLGFLGDLPEILRVFFEYYFYEDAEGEEVRNNNLVGELDCCAKEIYRRLISKYEDLKIKEHGDVI